MPTDKEVCKLAAIIHVDVKGYSCLMSEDDSYTVRALRECRQLFDENIRNQEGGVSNARGDFNIAEFSIVVSAVWCAVEIQEQLKDRNDDLSNERKMIFRIGISPGDVMQSEDAICDDAVNIVAAHIQALKDLSVFRGTFD